MTDATFDFATISGIITSENKTGSKRKSPLSTGDFGATITTYSGGTR